MVCNLLVVPLWEHCCSMDAAHRVMESRTSLWARLSIFNAAGRSHSKQPPPYNGGSGMVQHLAVALLLIAFLCDSHGGSSYGMVLLLYCTVDCRLYETFRGSSISDFLYVRTYVYDHLHGLRVDHVCRAGLHVRNVSYAIPGMLAEWDLVYGSLWHTVSS